MDRILFLYILHVGVSRTWTYYTAKNAQVLTTVDIWQQACYMQVVNRLVQDDYFNRIVATCLILTELLQLDGIDKLVACNLMTSCNKPVKLTTCIKSVLSCNGRP